MVAGAVSGLSSAIAVAQAVNGKSFWMWLFFAALALVAASFYSFHRARVKVESERESLPGKIDDLHRYGLNLLDEVSEEPKPKEVAKGQWSIEFGEAPSDWWDKAAAFDQMIRDLFVARYPALLSDYAAGANEHLRQEREKDEERAKAIRDDPKLDRRSDAERMRAFAAETQSGPARRVRACLQGLAAARHRATG